MTTPSAIHALYAHVPFCRTRCGYCDFYSTVLEPAAVEPLVSGLLTELDAARNRHELAFETIFVGGGTPTCLPPRQLERLLLACAELGRGGQIEFTVEANPATVTPETAAVLVAAGVNRVSVGAQSFDPDELQALERTHQPEQVGQTLEICRAQGIHDINLDLIFAIPGQTAASWRANLAAAIALEPTHLSCYGLTYEPGTRLHARLQAGEVRRVDEDLEADLYEMTIEILASAGYEHYEVSNFARPGARCRHNLTYWHNQPYLGIGPSAAGFVDGLRYKNVADIATYVREIAAGRPPHAEAERLAPEQRARETAMLALRLAEGLDRRSFTVRFGHDPVDFFADAVATHTQRGHLEVYGKGASPDAAGTVARGQRDCGLPVMR